MINIFTFFFGAIVGSFLNVVIYRLPLGKSVVSPRSTCGNCQKIIPWYFNIPILSYIFLRGKCGMCKTSISMRYPLVELITGLISLKIFAMDYLWNFDGLFLFFVACLFICHFFIDLDHHILPNVINIILAFIFMYLGLLKKPFLDVILGGAIGMAFPLAITWVFYKLRGVVGLGGGDIKLFGALGLYLGIKGVVYNMILSCWIGAIGGVFLILIKRLQKDHPFAFGPYIILASSLQIFFPEAFVKLWGLLGINY